MFTVQFSSVVKQVHISAHEQSYFLPVGVLCDTTTVNKIQHFIYWKPRPCLIRKTVITPETHCKFKGISICFCLLFFFNYQANLSIIFNEAVPLTCSLLRQIPPIIVKGQRWLFGRYSGDMQIELKFAS